MKWISVKDRLPDEFEYVFVALNKGFSPSNYEVCLYIDCFESQANGDDITEYVTYWMPLPKPPKV